MKFLKVAFAAALFAACGMLACPDASAQGDPSVKLCMPPNLPVGSPKGIFPGRVVWSHAPGAASWDGSDTPWFDDRFNSQEACDRLIDSTLKSLTGKKHADNAWDAVFTHFNSTHSKGKRGYRPGERITIKINNNNTYSHADSPEINASPQLLLALLTSLVEEAGVPQECITVAEPSRFITDYLFNKCHDRYPGVKYVDHIGGDGRIKTEYVDSVMHYSADNGRLARGIASPFVDADYLINMALLKGHVGQGVTLCGKNWYGCMSIDSNWRKNHHNNFDQKRDGSPKYMTFVDFMGHRDLGGKTMLWLIDALYGCRNVDGAPAPKWQMEPFGGNWPCSLLGSLDPVAIDMVGVDLLTAEFPGMPDADFCDMYLMEAAQAGAPSGTVYDPEADGRPLTSLGLAEHWDNPASRRYRRLDLVYNKIK